MTIIKRGNNIKLQCPGLHIWMTNQKEMQISNCYKSQNSGYLRVWEAAVFGCLCCNHSLSYTCLLCGFLQLVLFHSIKGFVKQSEGGNYSYLKILSHCSVFIGPTLSEAFNSFLNQTLRNPRQPDNTLSKHMGTDIQYFITHTYIHTPFFPPAETLSPLSSPQNVRTSSQPGCIVCFSTTSLISS